MHIHGGHRQKSIDLQRLHFENGRLAAILDFLVSFADSNFSLAFNINSKLKFHNTSVYG